MKFINISGPRNDIDRVTDLYLSRYEIQLESALSELKTVDNLRPFVEINPYKDALGKAEEFAGYLVNADEISPDTSLGLDDIFELIRTTNEAYLKIQSKKETLKKETETLLNKQKLIEPFRPLDGELDRILHYKYINYRFGRIPVEQYGRLEKYLMDDLGAIFVKGEQDESYLYGVYFVSPGEAQKVDAVFRSLHFEKITIPDEYTGTPADAIKAEPNRSQRFPARSMISIRKPLICLLKKHHRSSHQNNGWKNLHTILMSGKWLPAWRIRKKTTTFYAAGCQKTTLPALWKKSRMMTRYLLSWKKTEHLFWRSSGQAAEPEAVQPLKCSSACTDFLLTTRSIRLFLLLSPTPLFSELCSVMWGRDCCC